MNASFKIHLLFCIQNGIMRGLKATLKQIMWVIIVTKKNNPFVNVEEKSRFFKPVLLSCKLISLLRKKKGNTSLFPI